VLRSSDEEIPTTVCSVKKGDLVRVADGTFARVLCVVQIEREFHENYDESELVEFRNSGLKITKKHPIWINGEWRFPISCVNSSENSSLAFLCRSTSKYVYNFVLDRCHTILVNGTPCVTFGHGIAGPVTWHPFYATKKVLEAVSAQPGFSDGFVRVVGSLRNFFVHQQQQHHHHLEQHLQAHLRVPCVRVKS